MIERGNRNGVALSTIATEQANDPRHTALRQWQHTHEMTSSSVEPDSQPRRPQAPSSTSSTIRRPSPPPTSRDPAAAQRRHVASRDAFANGRTLHASPPLQHSAIRVPSDGRTRVRPNGFTTTADHERKGGEFDNPARESTRKGTRSREYQHLDVGATVESFEAQRARLIRMQRRFAAMHQVQAAPSPVAGGYFEFASPVRPQEGAGICAATGVKSDHRNSNQRTQDARVPTARRSTPDDVMSEFDDNLWRSFNERQHPSMAISRDASEFPDEDDGDDHDQGEADDTTFPTTARGSTPQANGTTRTHQLAQDASPPPVMLVRVQPSFPPFREEISHSRSDSDDDEEVPAPTVDEDGDPYVSQYVPTSEDLGVHLPASSDFESIPSISLTPPASPAHRRSRPNTASDLPSTSQRPPATAPQRFSTMSLAFIAGCIAAGLTGFYIEELLDFGSALVTSASLTVSRAEQREMKRRLDLLQRELTTFKTAAIEIELQSQRMVQEVRVHLNKMKEERQRHQNVISNEMVALRAYVHDVTNELVEEEKKEIRKRLMETIAETMVPADAPTIKADQPLVEVDVSTATFAEQEATHADEAATHEAVMQQVDRAIASAESHSVQANTTAVQLPSESSEKSSSFISLEWMILLTGIALIAGVVRNRVRIASLRSKNRNRRTWRFQQSTAARARASSPTTDESEVETVNFIRGSSEADPDEELESESDAVDDDDEYDNQDEDEEDLDTSVYSDEEEEKEDDTTGVADPNGYSTTFSSDVGEYDFQPAQFSEDAPEVELLDETPSSPGPSPLPAGCKTDLSEDATDDSASVRRSPRIQSRSSLAYMR